MKWFVLLCVFVGVLAEPPRFRAARFRFQRQELVSTTTDPPSEPTTQTESSNPEGPYPPSGWKPVGEPFKLPNEKHPEDIYGAPSAGGYAPSGRQPAGKSFNFPQQQPPPRYGSPGNTYGAPDSTSVTSIDATTTELPDNSHTEELAGPVEVQKSVGTYYVLLPNGQLQKVEFLTENDILNMRYTARLQLRDRAPLFVYRP